VESGGRELYVAYRDVVRQLGVEREHQPRRFDPSRRFDADHLPCCVHAGVGAAGRGDAHGFAGDLAPSALELALHRATIGLRLPAGELGSVVRQRQLKPRHVRSVAVRTEMGRG
jgi:hypothetical protein